MRWAWKSTIWKKIAKKLWYTFIDLDHFLESKVQMKIEKYVEKKWWDMFRDLEHRGLKNVLELNWKKLIALWWWTIVFERNVEEIQKLKCKNIFFLDSDIEEIVRRIKEDEKDRNRKRPPLKWDDTVKELKEVYKERVDTYKKNSDFVIKNNLDYIVADSLSPVFGKLQFDLILALNVLELVEPIDLLKQISKQISSGYFVISDPYDFDRGVNSVKKSFDESSLRMNLENLGFKILSKTKKPSYLPWNLKLNPRATLKYKVDLVISKK